MCGESKTMVAWPRLVCDTVPVGNGGPEWTVLRMTNPMLPDIPTHALAEVWGSGWSFDEAADNLLQRVNEAFGR